MFEAYITNTALYPLMGIEVGTTVHFPMTTQELQAALAKIGIDGKRYSEVFFTSFDSDVLGLYDYLYECENIDELNELGHALLEVRDKGGLETFEAALVLGNHTRSVKDLINLTQNLDLYRFYPDISDDEGLGRLYADELGTIDIPEHIQNYFDYEAYGRDVRINEGGVFAPGGYIQDNGLTDYEQLAQKATEAADRFHAISEQIKQTEQAMKTNAGLKAATVQYAKTRPVFEQYKATKYSRKFLAEHEADLELYRAAQAEMRSLLGGAKLPKMDVLKEEGRKLTAKKKQLYGEYQKARRDMQEIVTIKANIDTLMGYTEPGRKQEKER